MALLGTMLLVGAGVSAAEPSGGAIADVASNPATECAALQWNGYNWNGDAWKVNIDAVGNVSSYGHEGSIVTGDVSWTFIGGVSLWTSNYSDMAYGWTMKNGGSDDRDDDFQSEWYTGQGDSNSATAKFSHIAACFADDYETTTTTAGPTTTIVETTTTTEATTTTVVGGPSTTSAGPTATLSELPYTGGGGPVGSTTLFLIGLGVLLAGVGLFFGSCVFDR